ncbi:hypothetical protein GGR53DRAFT_516534 [Hypoxylon sp. FL1150]|nr:hypothetical protein GGR53DRAFT_516534 [Hypoxylon sp. FL1150]
MTLINPLISGNRNFYPSVHRHLSHLLSDDMAESASSGGELRVSKCQCETGRQRHRIPKSKPIPFETPDPIVLPNQDDSEDETNENDETDSDSGSSHNGTDLGILAHAHIQHLGEGTWEVDFAVEGLDPNEIDIDGAIDTLIAQAQAETETETEAQSPSPSPEPTGLSDSEDPPPISKWRLNLTALSQVYNIYMVAYQTRVHISRPRSCITNALPAEPDLILEPPASDMGLRIGGYLDELFPHQVNHLVVGELGQEEILLLAFDDGDVIGYYTRHIEKELVRREMEEQSTGSVPEPFFHENVGKSAWGLAVHKQSRIIAVSSNLHTVSVFVFALTGASYQHTKAADSVELFRNVMKDERGKVIDVRKSSPRAPGANPETCKALEASIQHRDANWRIVLETGRVGTNIPNITFSDDQHGEADMVVAVDINGTLWLMDIWHFYDHPYYKIDSLHGNRYYRNPRGWGVLVLPESSFLPTKNYMHSVGVTPSEAKYVEDDKLGKWVDISQGIKHVKNNSTVHPWMRSGDRNRFAINPLEHGFRHRADSSWCHFANIAKGPPLCDVIGMDGNLPFQYDTPWRYKPTRGPKRLLGNGSSIMRTYELDIELRNFAEDGYGIFFERAIEQTRPPHTVLPSMRASHERLANLIHVPELSLVVAGSLCGRVALVTLTRPKENIYSFSRGFKIEAILPTKCDEDSHMRPICPLLGVAVAPVPFSGNTDLAEGPIGPRRYRIMLHYYDLRILSYELYRDSEDDRLSIF